MKKIYIILAAIIMLAVLPSIVCTGNTAPGMQEPFVISMEDIITIDDIAVPTTEAPLRGDIAILLIGVIVAALVGATVMCIRGRRAEMEHNGGSSRTSKKQNKRRS